MFPLLQLLLGAARQGAMRSLALPAEMGLSPPAPLQPAASHPHLEQVLLPLQASHPLTLLPRLTSTPAWPSLTPTAMWCGGAATGSQPRAPLQRMLRVMRCPVWAWLQAASSSCSCSLRAALALQALRPLAPAALAVLGGRAWPPLQRLRCL